jgi:hypothetical protein
VLLGLPRVATAGLQHRQQLLEVALGPVFVLSVERAARRLDLCPLPRADLAPCIAPDAVELGAQGLGRGKDLDVGVVVELLADEGVAALEDLESDVEGEGEDGGVGGLLGLRGAMCASLAWWRRGQE